MRPTYVDYFNDMLSHCEAAEAFVRNMDLKRFRQDQMAIMAVLRALEIIGEAARNIPASVRSKYPDIPWRDIIGMRNVLIHGCSRVDIEVIWKAAREDVPPLKGKVIRAIAEEERRG